MKKISAKKSTEIYDAMLLRHCYPYCITLDLENETIAFRNRNYFFLHAYPPEVDKFWFHLEQLNFERLNDYLASTAGVQQQTFGKRFLDFFLYNDGNPPMDKKYYERYRRILDKVLSIANNQDITDRLTKGNGGFNFGKMNDGEYKAKNENEETVNVYEMARKEHRFYVNPPY